MTSTAVVKSPKGAMAKLLEPRAEALEHLLPKGLDVHRVIAAAQLAAYQNPALLECDPVSIFLSVGRIAQWGLQIGITAHLVPFGKTCTAVKDFKGVIELIIRSRAARTVRVGTRREGDFFDMEEGTEPHIKHRATPNSSSAMVGFYAIAHHGRDIPPTFRYLSVEQVEAVRRKYSKQHKNGPLEEWYGLKTVVHRLGKYLVQNPELAAMLDDDMDAALEVNTDRPLLPTEGDVPRHPTPLAHADADDPYGHEAGGFDTETGEVLEGQ
ncbi:MAG TPA: recombinase RecT [Gemmatimonadaceae bacterium]|nr:recombinase RecT [Gemmatimonadaceae bacterium]